MLQHTVSLILLLTTGQILCGTSNSPLPKGSLPAASSSQGHFSYPSYEDYGSTGTGRDSEDYSEYYDYSGALEEEGEEDRQDLGLVGIFGLGGIGLGMIATVFASALFGSLMAPVMTGIFSSLSERISESDFELPELPFRAMKYASLDDRRSLDASSLLSWIDSAEQLYSALSQ